MIAAVLALGLFAKGELEFSHAIDRGEVVIEALGQELGLDLRASGALVDDRIFVRLRDTDWETAKPMLAEGLRSEWRERGDILYLHRPSVEPGQTTRQRIADTFREWQKAARVDEDYSYESLVEQLLQYQEDQNASNYEYRYGYAIEDYVYLDDPKNPKGDADHVMGPGSRAIMRLIPLIDADDVADLLDGPATFASMDPKARDLSLPRAARAVFKTFWTERETLRRVVEVVPGVETGYYWGYGESLLPEVDAPLLYISVDEGGIELELVVPFNGELNIVGAVRIFLDSFLDWEEQQARENFAYLSDPLRLTKDQNALTKIMVPLYAWDPEEPLLDRETIDYARGLMADPVANDPMRLVCQPILEQAAESRGMSMVALLSEWSPFTPFWAMEEIVTVGTALNGLVNGMWTAESVERDGYWLLYPDDLSRLEGERVDRKRVKAFIEEAVRIDALTVENLVGLYTGAGSESAFELSMRYVDTAFGGEDLYYGGSSAIKLLSQLGPAALQQMREAGYTVFGADLPADVQRRILMAVCNLWDDLTDEPFDPEADYDYGVEVSYEEAVAFDQKTTYTVMALRDGIPKGVKVQLRLITEPTLSIKGLDEDELYGQSGYEFEVDEYADMLSHYRQADEETRKRWYERMDFTQVSLGFSESLYVIIEFPGFGFTYDVLEVPTGRISEEFIDYKNLPANIRARIEKVIREQAGDDGGGRP